MFAVPAVEGEQALFLMTSPAAGFSSYVGLRLTLTEG